LFSEVNPSIDFLTSTNIYIQLNFSNYFVILTMLSKIIPLSFLISGALTIPLNSDVDIPKRASCPGIHVFGARETTASAGYGSSSTVVNAVLQAYSGSTAEAINYPACGGQSSCGGASYSESVAQGIAAVASAVNSFNEQCPDSQIVLVGYSQVCRYLV
jgi:acetylxylan esterase